MFCKSILRKSAHISNFSQPLLDRSPCNCAPPSLCQVAKFHRKKAKNLALMSLAFIWVLECWFVGRTIWEFPLHASQPDSICKVQSKWQVNKAYQHFLSSFWPRIFQLSFSQHTSICTTFWAKFIVFPMADSPMASIYIQKLRIDLRKWTNIWTLPLRLYSISFL